MAHQPSIFPEFVRAGVMDELAREGLFSMGICFRKTRDGEVVAGRRFEKGEKALLLLPQWRFREILRRRVGGYADAEVRVGWRVEGIEGGCGERRWWRGGDGAGTVYRGGEWAAQLCQGGCAGSGTRARRCWCS